LRHSHPSPTSNRRSPEDGADTRHPGIKASSAVMANYNTRAADDQIPLRVFAVQNGSFKVEGQTGQRFTWLSYNP